MVMRVGGLATGMDIESMVNKLMDAERIPLTKMEQDKMTLTWKRDAFRDVNRGLLELQELTNKMKLPSSYRSKMVTSSQENAITATGTSGASEGSYNIEVSQLASAAVNVSKTDIEDPNEALNKNETIEFSTYKADGSEDKHTVDIKETDSLNDVLSKITKGDNNVRAFYDKQSKKVIIESTRTGKYNTDPDGSEIMFDEDPFFAETLKMDATKEKGGENAIFTYNGVELESKENAYSLNGINFQFHGVTEGQATINVRNDVESTFESIVTLVETYNGVIEKLNDSQTEEIHRDFPPLTDEQKKEMSEDEIDKWEEKAKSGLFRSDSTLSGGMYEMRQGWYAQVDTGEEVNFLTQIGIKTSKNYMDGGKLIVDETQLRQALNEDPKGVEKLFVNSDEDESRGLVNRLGDAIKDTMDQIERKAGKSTHTLDNYTLGKQMKNLNERITTFETRMERVEERYWNQFTQMEKAIQRMNDQSSQLLSQFGE